MKLGFKIKLPFLVFLLQSLHVLGNVLSEDAIAMSLSIVLLGRGIVAEETSLTKKSTS
jgi:hypothetical protein